MRTVALNAEAVISNQVFDPKKVPKTPRPMSNSVGKKRCRNISQRASETKIVVESPRKTDNEHNLEVTGAPSHLNAQQVRGSPRKSAASLNLIQIIPPSEDRADDEEVMAGTGAEEGLDETTRSLLAIEYPDNKMSDYEKESFVAPLGQSSPRNERIIDEKNEANEEDSQMNSSKISDNSTRSRESRRSMSHQNDEFSTQSSQNESLNDSRLDEEVGLECSRSPRDRAKDETTSQSEKTLDEPKLVRNGNESNFPSEKMPRPKKQNTRENQKSKTSEADQNMSSNNDLNTTFESDTSCVQPSVNRPYTVPEYKIEKYNVPELRPKSASAREKSQSKQVSDSVQNFHLPKEVQQRYDIISDEPWGFESYYEPLLPGNYEKLDLDYLATTNAKDWRNSISDLCHPDEVEVETGLLDRLLEIAKQQSATVKLEEELKRRPRYMRPRSSQLSTAASVASAVGTSGGDTYAPATTTSRQTPPAPPSLPRARSALASLSSRFCPECKHIPCSDSCRYQVQQTGASTKVAPLFKRCYLCRQMNCPGSNNCASHQKMKQIHSARYERTKSSTSSKSSAVGSAGSEGRPTNRLLAIEYHHDRSYATSLANQKRLIKMTNKTNRSSSRPKSAGSSSARRNQARQENTLRNQRKEIGVCESGSRSSLNQVDLSNHLADNLDFESAHRPANGGYLPKPPPTGRDILTLEQRLSVLAMPANKLSRCKSSAAPAANNMEIQTFKPRKSKSPRSTDGMWRSSRESRGNSSNGTSIVELLVPRIAVPSQPEPPPVYVSVYRSHNVATGTGRFRGTKRLGGRMTAFT